MPLNKQMCQRMCVMVVSVCIGLLCGCGQSWELPGGWTPANGREMPLYVNLQVDAEGEDVTGLSRIADELRQRGIPATFYVTADYADDNPLLVRGLYEDGFEIALHGRQDGEHLSMMTYPEQAALLAQAKETVESCRPEGMDEPITGFRPQLFNQDELTCCVLYELGMEYNAGFKVGQIFEPGHEQTASPYPLNHLPSLAAVPVTTMPCFGNTVFLCDVDCAQGQGMTGEQWSLLLHESITQSLTRSEPLVLIIHGWYTGDGSQYDYWSPFIAFLDELEGTAVFVTTGDLVEAYRDR